MPKAVPFAVFKILGNSDFYCFILKQRNKPKHLRVAAFEIAWHFPRTNFRL